MDAQDRDEDADCSQMFGVTSGQGTWSTSKYSRRLCYLGPDRDDHIYHDHHIEDDDDQDWDPNEPDTLPEIHPAVWVIGHNSVDSVGDHAESRHPPAQNHQNSQPVLVTLEGVEQHHLEVASLAQHPEVGGDGEVGDDEVEDPAPYRVVSPERRERQDSRVPDQPAEVAEDEAEEEVEVDRDSAAVKGLVGGEDQGCSQEREEGQDVTHVPQQKHVGPVEQLITEDIWLDYMFTGNENPRDPDMLSS